MSNKNETPKNKLNKGLLILIVILIIFFSTIALAIYLNNSSRTVMEIDDSKILPPKNVVTAPSSQPPDGGLLNAPLANKPPEDIALKDRKKPDPPQELLDYLDFVKGVEQHRQMLLRDTARAQQLTSAAGQTRALMTMINWAMNPDGADAVDPLSDAKKELDRQHKNWEQTLKYFDKRQAPPEARDFSGLYRKMLVAQTSAIGAIALSFRNVNLMSTQDLQRLLSQLNEIKADKSIQAKIDQATENADNALNMVISKYNFPEKPFDVEKERPGLSVINL